MSSRPNQPAPVVTLPAEIDLYSRDRAGDRLGEVFEPPGGKVQVRGRRIPGRNAWAPGDAPAGKARR